MKILVVNRNFFVTGGPETYLFTLMELMPQNEFIPFCVRFDRNRETPYSRYFVDPPGGDGQVYFRDFRMSPGEKISYAWQSVYSFGNRKKLETLIRDTGPDVALFLNAHYFSDSIIDACHRFNLPIIWRMSDFHKVCANYLLFRDGSVCEECLDRGPVMALRHGCGGYQRSYVAALVKVAGMWLARFRGSYDKVNYFVTPSAFTRKMMIRGGFPPDRVVHIPTFVDTGIAERTEPGSAGGILFVGRLSHEKGVEQLIEAFGLLKAGGAALTIAGDAGSAYGRRVIDAVPAGLRDRVRFIGQRTRQQVSQLYRDNPVLVIPSLWYENQPNVLLEGMAHGCVTVVPSFGSLAECVDDGITGCRFEPGNPRDLAAVLDRLLNDPRRCVEIGQRAQRYVRENHGVERHLASLDALFRSCL